MTWINERYEEKQAKVEGQHTLLGSAHLPLYRRLHETLLHQIADGTFRSGAPLPAEMDLAKIYGVAPGTARKAIDQLAEDGLVERRQGAGTFIRRPNFDNLMIRFFQHRLTDGSNIIPESRIIKRCKAKADAQIAAALDIKLDADIIHLVRHRSWDGQTKLLEDIFLSFELFHPLFDIPLADIGPLLYPAYDEYCHQLVCFIEEEITVDKASDEDANDLGIEKDALSIFIHRQAKNAKNCPIEWRISRADVRNFHYRIKVN
ncbi:GntR family transcriptional regulator (plasmid) [Bartonella sp. HY329]|uniref:GntR family transcriptional regulator n=1 Tax=unclassified Bartonella TaxID=2645622 RepID=UPI0021C9F854|nr:MULTISPECIES: GntR family transcriptional regulator [unclassified Bartonella]UXM96626.1 GntR family transcriptional regulator [Bartonella sp. HY329]UXN10949.1 GntR family transcriptional regulator [Bartonella sp. HY328]